MKITTDNLKKCTVTVMIKMIDGSDANVDEVQSVIDIGGLELTVGERKLHLDTKSAYFNQAGGFTEVNCGLWFDDEVIEGLESNLLVSDLIEKVEGDFYVNFEHEEDLYEVSSVEVLIRINGKTISFFI
jgi:hypothetical protein